MTWLPPDQDFSDLFDPVPSKPVQREVVPAAEHVSLTHEGLDGQATVAYTDGGCRGNPGPAGYGVFIRHQGQVIRLKGTLPHATNNEAEYAGLLACLRWSVEHKVRRLIVNMDSELVVRHMQGRYGVNPKLRPLYLHACALVLDIGDVLFMHVHREFNREADRLATAAMDEAGFPRQRKGERQCPPGDQFRNTPTLKP